MRRLARALLAVVGVLGLLVVAVVIYVTTIFDPNDLKPRLVEAVQQQSGLEMELEGPLSWSFYPRLGMSVEAARAWLPEQPRKATPFVAVDRAEVSLAFAPLLSGEIAIDGLLLKGMRVDLVRDERGRGNWETLMDHLQRGNDVKHAFSPAAAGPGIQKESAEVALDIASVTVSDSRISFEDQGNGLQLTARDLSLDSTNVNPAEPFPLQSDFVLESAAPGLTSEVSLVSKLRLGIENARYVLENPRLDIDARLTQYPEHHQRVSFKAARGVAALNSDTYRLDDARIDATLSHPVLGKQAMPFEFALGLEANTARETVELRDVQLSGENGLDLTGDLSVTDALTTPAYTGQVKLAPLPLRAWLERLGVDIDTADDDALSRLALSSPVKGNAEHFSLTDLSLSLDDTAFSGQLGAGLDGLSYTFDLQGEALDLDRYLPPEKAGALAVKGTTLSAPGIASAYAQEDASELLPMPLLSELSLNGQLALTELKVKGVTLLEPRLSLQGSQGQHRLERLAARLYDGALDATASLDATRTPLRWSLSPKLESVQLVPLIEDYADMPSPLRGRLSMQGDLSSQGNTQDALLRNLNGKAQFQVADGAVFDVNLSRQLCTAVAVLEGERTTREWAADTRLERLDGQVRIVDGVVHNDDFRAVMPGIELAGQGRLNLPTERFDYQARARFIDTADVACEVNPRLERIVLPIRCQGTLSGEPEQWCNFDRQGFQQSLRELARDEAKRKASERIEEKLKDSLGEKAAGELGNTLRGLLD